MISETVQLGKHCDIHGKFEIGEKVDIGPGCSLGRGAEHLFVNTDWQSPIYVGANTIIREHVVIHRGTMGGAGTFIGSDCYIMNGVYIAHDVLVESGVRLAAHVCLGGKVRVLTGAGLGMQVAVHQYRTIGAYAMIGMGAMVTKDVPPGETWAGVPARKIGMNELGLTREKVSEEMLSREHERWDELIHGQKR